MNFFKIMFWDFSFSLQWLAWQVGLGGELDRQVYMWRILAVLFFKFINVLRDISVSCCRWTTFLVIDLYVLKLMDELTIINLYDVAHLLLELFEPIQYCLIKFLFIIEQFIQRFSEIFHKPFTFFCQSIHQKRWTYLSRLSADNCHVVTLNLMVDRMFISIDDFTIFLPS